jgi:3' terminal RNA ribose 2'-O-methyltransferase Hen1
MLLTISIEAYEPATDLSYLLHKNPARFQTFELSFGQAHVFYPQATDTACTAALLLDINPVALVRRGTDNHFALRQYVNDRPYASTSLMSVAIAKVYGSALKGKSTDRPDMVNVPLPLTIQLTALPCPHGEDLLYELFMPLGYELTVEPYPLDEKFPAWGEGHYVTLTLANTLPLKDILAHLYVLIPVLDDEKHYYVSHDEIEKLLRYGESWLANHPLYELITRRYLRHQHSLTQEALTRILSDEIITDEPSPLPEPMMNLHQIRLTEVASRLKAVGARRVLDLGCGEGQLLQKLLADWQFSEIVGMDVAFRSLERAQTRLGIKNMPDDQRARIQLIHGSLMYDDPRLVGYDAAAIVEVIEHLDEYRLSAFERVVFDVARPRVVIITTPNSEYNVKYPTLSAGQFRHDDHRFEWTRAQFTTWAQAVAEKYGYVVTISPLGDSDPVVGAPSQLAQFERQA